MGTIPAVKGAEIGAAFDQAALQGTQVHDPITVDADGRLSRSSNRAGGLEGGITTGEPLIVRGASLDNAVCFDRDGIMNPGGLRFPDECCRHKSLDLIGDLALIGRPLLGHVMAERAGHAMHVALVAKIMSDPSLYEILTFDQLAGRVAEVLVS